MLRDITFLQSSKHVLPLTKWYCPWKSVDDIQDFCLLGDTLSFPWMFHNMDFKDLQSALFSVVFRGRQKHANSRLRGRERRKGEEVTEMYRRVFSFNDVNKDLLYSTEWIIRCVCSLLSGYYYFKIRYLVIELLWMQRMFYRVKIIKLGCSTLC